MPLDPEELDGIGDEVAAHYSALELAVLAAVAETARRGLARPGWAAEQARLFPRLASQIRRLVADGTTRGVSLAADAVSEAAKRGRDSARADLAAIEETVARNRAVPPAVRPVDGARTFGPTPARVTPTSPVQATSGPRDLTPASVAQVPPSPASASVAAVRAEAARQATTEALETAGRAVTERALNRWQQVVAEMARAELAGDATSLQVQQRVLDEWARRGLPAFTDKAGRTWSLQAYAEMNVRTATHQAFGDAHRAELAGAGMDLVIVSSHRNPADVCQPYERKVLSLSGRLSGSVQVPSATSDELVTVQVYSSLDMAKANGYNHPNCKHVESAYVPGVSRPGGTRPNPAGYAATQEQRRLERGIREWKRREAVALTDEARAKAKAKVLEWQGRTREHIKVHGLDRRYYREQVRVGAA